MYETDKSYVVCLAQVLHLVFSLVDSLYQKQFVDNEDVNRSYGYMS